MRVGVLLRAALLLLLAVLGRGGGRVLLQHGVVQFLLAENIKANSYRRLAQQTGSNQDMARLPRQGHMRQAMSLTKSKL